MNKPNQTDLYRTHQSTTMEYIFFSSTHVTFTKNDYILDHKKPIIKKDQVYIMYSFDHNEIN